MLIILSSHTVGSSMDKYSKPFSSGTYFLIYFFSTRIVNYGSDIDGLASLTSVTFKWGSCSLCLKVDSV